MQDRCVINVCVCVCVCMYVLGICYCTCVYTSIVRMECMYMSFDTVL